MSRLCRALLPHLLLILVVACGGTSPSASRQDGPVSPGASAGPTVPPAGSAQGSATGPGGSAAPAGSAAEPSATGPSPSSTAGTGPGASASATPSPSVEPSASPSSPAGTPTPGASAVPSASPRIVRHDPAKFGFAAKGMSNEVMAFVTVGQLEYAIETMDWDVVSTVAYFSLEATREGTIARNAGWDAWNSERMERLIDTAHEHGSKVVISLERFSWSPGQTAASRRLLSDKARRDRLAREVAAEVERRGADGVNIDFEPIPSGQKKEFTDFVRAMRRELDRVRPGLQLTFCVVGHHESYDVAGATGPDAADAVYLMGYHYAGIWSSRAGSTAPMGGPAYDLVETVKSLLREVERHELIVGVPYYGHAWPTVGDRLNARTEGGGFDVPVERAFALAARHGLRYDKREQVAWVPYRAEPCDGCATRWYQLYFDDARAARFKWGWIERSNLLGTGVWTIGFEGRPGELDAAMRDVFLHGAGR